MANEKLAAAIADQFMITGEYINGVCIGYYIRGKTQHAEYMSAEAELDQLRLVILAAMQNAELSGVVKAWEAANVH